MQTPQYRVDSSDALQTHPITSGEPEPTPSCSELSRMQRTPPPAVVNHYNVQPLYDIYANVTGATWAASPRDIDKVMNGYQGDSCRRHYLEMRGQVETMRTRLSA